MSEKCMFASFASLKEKAVEQVAQLARSKGRETFGATVFSRWLKLAPAFGMLQLVS
jgi:hypothetical protein